MKKDIINKNLKVLTKAFLAGIMISIGGAVNLMMTNKIVGACLFSIGLFLIVANGYNLYTGKIGYIIDNKKDYLIELGITLLGNILGTVGCGYLLLLSRVGTNINKVARSISQVKLNDTWYSILILSIFCGMLMYLAVNTCKKLENSGKYISIFMCVVVFILSSYEHCVANMFYFSAANMWSFKTILYVLLMILGNSLGSIIISGCTKYYSK